LRGLPRAGMAFVECDVVREEIAKFSQEVWRLRYPGFFRAAVLAAVFVIFSQAKRVTGELFQARNGFRHLFDAADQVKYLHVNVEKENLPVKMAEAGHAGEVGERGLVCQELVVQGVAVRGQMVPKEIVRNKPVHGMTQNRGAGGFDPIVFPQTKMAVNHTFAVKDCLPIRIEFPQKFLAIGIHRRVGVEEAVGIVEKDSFLTVHADQRVPQGASAAFRHVERDQIHVSIYSGVALEFHGRGDAR
jgi:hypothetical protein